MNAVGLNAAQAEMAQLIEAAFARAGYPPALAAAAVVNAHAESGLNPRAAAPAPEDSVGLFQLNARGAGHGMTTAQRQDPYQNVGRILQVIAGSSGKRLRELAQHSGNGAADVARLAAVFCEDIERPANAAAAGAARAARALIMYPFGVSGGRVSDEATPTVLAPAAPGIPSWLAILNPVRVVKKVPGWGWGLLFLVSAVGVGFFVHRRWRRKAAA